MAAAKITPTYFTNVGETTISAKVTKVTQNDWVVLPESGVIDFGGVVYTGAVETFLYTTVTVNNASTAYTATTTTIAYDGATALQRPSGNYYLLTTGGEIIYVISDDGYDSTSGNLTVRRGCLGTTASATGVANNNVCYVMNSLVLGSATTGSVLLSYKALPVDPGVNFF